MSHLKRMVILLPVICQLSMIFKKFLVKRKEEGQNSMSRRLLKRSSKEEKDIEDDDSEVETQNKESYERAHLQTQLKDLKKLKEAFKEEGEKYFQYCSRREITTLCRWCNYILREKYDMDKELFDKCRQKCHPHKSDIRDLAYSRYTPRYEKRRILQKNQVGEGIVSGMLPLILDTIKSLLQMYNCIF